MPTAEKGTVEDVLVITYQDGATKEIPLKAVVIGNPTWKSNPESLEVENSLWYQRRKDNPGNQQRAMRTLRSLLSLLLGIQLPTWRLLDKSTVDYVFKSKLDGFDVPYKWVDITNDYTEHMPYAYYIDKTDSRRSHFHSSSILWQEVQGDVYLQYWFRIFDAPVEDYKQFPEPPASLPTTETFYTNIICPFWGNHSMNTPSSDGVYYKAKDDKVIVEL